MIAYRVVDATYLFNETAIRAANELKQKLDLLCERNFFFDAREGLRGVETGAGQNAEGILQRLNRIGRKAAALKADAIRAVDFGLVSGGGDRVRKDVLFDDAVTADQGVATDAAKLMNGAEAADVGVILHNNVSGEGNAVREDGVVVDEHV